MSRAMNLQLPEQTVRDRCDKLGVSISAIEPLASGGTHLVCTTSDGANEMRLKLKSHIITGAVQRFAFYRPRGPA
jgi:hypothetical protein